MARFSAFVLDNYAAPKLGELNVCGAPPIDEPPNYSAAHILNSIFIIGWKDEVRRTVFMFVRRLEHAVREYRTAREHLEYYVQELPKRNNHFLRAMRAVTHFEQCVGATCQAFAMLKLISKQFDPERPELKDDRVVRLKKIWNRAKHFDEDIEEGKVAPGDIAAPTWLTNDGMECATAFVTFSELHAVITDFLEDAKILAEDLPRKLSEELQARQTAEKAEAEQKPDS